MAEAAGHLAVKATEDGRPGSGNLGDRAFNGVLWTLGIMVLVVAGLIVLNLALVARPLAKEHSLWGFITSTEWNPVEDHFGALTFLYGTLVTSAVSIVVSVPIAIGLSLFITQFAPPKLGRILTIPVELLAAIPSVVYGLWGLFIVVPWLRESIQPWLGKHLGFLPIFSGPPIGLGYMASGLILAVMMAVIPYSRAGILGAVLLGLGRALGETMAVTMVIGNSPQISASLFAPGYSLPAVIANEFAEATSAVHIGALAGLGLILFATTFLLNAGARVLVTAVQKGPSRVKG